MTAQDDTVDATDVAPAQLRTGQRVLAVVRILIGFVFLWAFLDKCFGLGIPTPHAQAWLFGTGPDPAEAFLAGITGPFAWLFNPIAGQEWATWLFMAGLLGIGVGLMSGLAFRFSAVCGVLLLAILYLAELPETANPFVSSNMIYALVLVALIPLRNGRVWGLSKGWERTVGARLPWLR